MPRVLLVVAAAAIIALATVTTVSALPSRSVLSTATRRRAHLRPKSVTYDKYSEQQQQRPILSLLEGETDTDERMERAETGFNGFEHWTAGDLAWAAARKPSAFIMPRSENILSDLHPDESKRFTFLSSADLSAEEKVWAARAPPAPRPAATATTAAAAAAVGSAGVASLSSSAGTATATDSKSSNSGDSKYSAPPPAATDAAVATDSKVADAVASQLAPDSKREWRGPTGKDDHRPLDAVVQQKRYARMHARLLKETDALMMADEPGVLAPLTTLRASDPFTANGLKRLKFPVIREMCAWSKTGFQPKLTRLYAPALEFSFTVDAARDWLLPTLEKVTSKDSTKKRLHAIETNWREERKSDSTAFRQAISHWQAHKHGVLRGKRLSFGQLTAMAGDFIADPAKPVCMATPERPACPKFAELTSEDTFLSSVEFIQTYASLCATPAHTVDLLLQYLRREKAAIDDEVMNAHKDGVADDARRKQLSTRGSLAYSKLGLTHEYALDYASDPSKQRSAEQVDEKAKKASEPNTWGGKISGKLNDRQKLVNVVEGKKYFPTAAKNFDHFGNCAIRAYVAGHFVASNMAVLARKYLDMSQIAARSGQKDFVVQAHWDAAILLLEEAYKMEGFAHHYLSDQFASGHLRTPRAEAHFAVAAFEPSVAGGLKGPTVHAGLGKLMHDEDNALGLKVVNDNGDAWSMFGDNIYFDDTNTDNRRIMHRTLTVSIEEITDSFDTGVVRDEPLALHYLPRVDPAWYDRGWECADVKRDDARAVSGSPAVRKAAEAAAAEERIAKRRASNSARYTRTVIAGITTTGGTGSAGSGSGSAGSGTAATVAALPMGGASAAAAGDSGADRKIEISLAADMKSSLPAAAAGVDAAEVCESQWSSTYPVEDSGILPWEAGRPGLLRIVDRLLFVRGGKPTPSGEFQFWSRARYTLVTKSNIEAILMAGLMKLQSPDKPGAVFAGTALKPDTPADPIPAPERKAARDAARQPPASYNMHVDHEVRCRGCYQQVVSGTPIGSGAWVCDVCIDPDTDARSGLSALGGYALGLVPSDRPASDKADLKSDRKSDGAQPSAIAVGTIAQPQSQSQPATGAVPAQPDPAAVQPAAAAVATDGQGGSRSYYY